MVETANYYSRYVTNGFQNFDPIELALKTEKLVCDGNSRKYTLFKYTREYGGIVTGHTSGCCLRCIFCWADWSRDFPEKVGHFYTAEDAFARLMVEARKNGTSKLRISGAEPTLCREHLLELLERVENSEISEFVLETNGMIFGIDKGYVESVSRFKKVHVRVSLKAGDPEGFAKKTGADPRSFEIPFQAIRNLIACNVKFNIALVSDPRMMSHKERAELTKRLEAIDRDLLLRLEEEILEPFPTSIVRLQYAGYKRWAYILPFAIATQLRKIPNKRIRNVIRRLMYLLPRTR